MNITRIRIHTILGALIFIPLFTFGQINPPIGPGNSYEFVVTSGGGSSFNIGNQVATGVRTIEVWFKLSTRIRSNLSQPITIIARDFSNGSALSTHEFQLYFRPSSWGNGGKLTWGRRVFSTSHEILSDRNDWRPGIWYHVAATMHPNSGMRMYINGVLQQSTNSSTNPIMGQSGSSFDDVSIGRWGNTSSPIRMFPGEMDEMRLWTVARTQAEIREYMCQKLQGNETNLRAYYRFDATSGSVLDDLTTNNYDGTLVGAVTPLWRTSSAPVGDLSAHQYPSSWPPGSPVVSLPANTGDELSVLSLPGTNRPDGVHIYRVDAVPAYTAGLPPCFPPYYFGVFVAHDNDTSFRYDMRYTLAASNVQADLYGRKHSAQTSWSNLNAAFNGTAGTLSMTNESYRREYIAAIETEPIDLGPDTLLCQSASLLLTADPGIGTSTYRWQDNSTGSQFNVTTPGLYWVERTDSCGTDRDSIVVNILPIPQANLGPDLTLCTGDTLVLQANNSPATRMWQDNSNGNSFVVRGPGVYWLEVSNLCGADRDSVNISYATYPQVNLGPDTLLCPGDQFSANATFPNATYTWQNNATSSNFTISLPGVYWVDVNNQGCISRDSIIVQELLFPTVFLGGDTALCNGDSLQVSAYSPLGTYLWQDNSTDSVLLIKQAGSYWVTAANVCGATSDTIDVDFFSAIPIDLGPDTVLCDGDSLLLRATWPGASYLWQNGTTADTLWATQTASYIVQVDKNCSKIDTINVLFGEVPFLDLGPDSLMCVGDTLVLDATTFLASYLWSTGDTTPTLAVTQSGVYWAEASSFCGTDRDTVNLEFGIPPPQPMLGNDTILCPGEVLHWEFAVPGIDYLWSSGSNRSFYIAREAGWYWVEFSTACRGLRDSVYMSFDTLNISGFPSDTILCDGDELLIEPQAQSRLPLTYRWQDGSVEPYHLVVDSGNYKLRISNRCSTFSDSLYVGYMRIPQPELPPDTLLCPGEVLLLNGSTPYTDFYQWSHGSNDSLQLVEKPGDYYLTTANICGEGRDTIHVSYDECDCTVFFANAFTPNGDNHNETFGPVHDCDFKSVRFAIFSRWGRKVFESNDPDLWWDGRYQGVSVPEGVYTWVFWYTGRQDREPFDAQLKGTVTIIR